LRRRRRQSTQIIHKKSNSIPSVSSYYTPPKSKRGVRKVLFFFTLVVILGSLSYYFYNLNLQDEITNPAKSENEKLDSSLPSPLEEEEQEPVPLVHTIQVEILNGCGINGVAKLFQNLLRENGIDVVNTENYTVDGKIFWDVDKTFIIDQIGVTTQAKSIAKILQIPLENIESRENPAAIYDISVVIGKDYKKYIDQ